MYIELIKHPDCLKLDQQARALPQARFVERNIYVLYRRRSHLHPRSCEPVATSVTTTERCDLLSRFRDMLFYQEGAARGQTLIDSFTRSCITTANVFHIRFPFQYKNLNYNRGYHLLISQQNPTSHSSPPLPTFPDISLQTCPAVLLQPSKQLPVRLINDWPDPPQHTLLL